MTLDILSITKIATPIIRQALDRYGLEDVRFDPDLDHDGDPVIRASLTYRSGAAQPPATTLVDAVTEVMSQMVAKGDERFVHLRHLHPSEVADNDDGWLDYGRRRRSSR